MADGNGTALPKATSKIVEKALARASRSWGGFRAWHRLEPDDRLALVETALTIPANNCADELPLAL